MQAIQRYMQDIQNMSGAGKLSHNWTALRRGFSAVTLWNRSALSLLLFEVKKIFIVISRYYL